MRDRRKSEGTPGESSRMLSEEEAEDENTGEDTEDESEVN